MSVLKQLKNLPSEIYAELIYLYIYVYLYVSEGEFCE